LSWRFDGFDEEAERVGRVVVGGGGVAGGSKRMDARDRRMSAASISAVVRSTDSTT
jgi:hypothetical protein